MNWPISACRLASVSLLSATLLFTAAGCEDANDLGVELPGTANADTQYRDFPVTASTVLRDSTETQKANRFLVGRVRENVLGSTAATAFLNLKLRPLALDSLPTEVKRAATVVAPNAILDSLVLEMPFDEVYGSAAAPLRVNVYQLAQPLDDRTTYNSSSSVALGPEIARGLSARLNGTRKDSVGTKPTRTQVTVPDRTVRLKLHGGGQTSTLATAVFDRLKAAGFNQAALDGLWKGIALQPVADFNTAVVGLQAAVPTRAVFYYRYTNKKNTGQLSGRYSIPFSKGSWTPPTLNDAPRYFTQITNELPANSVLSRLSGPNGATQAVSAAETNGLVYMQAGNGFGAKLEIPDLKTLRDLAAPQTNGSPAIAINRAELLIPVRPFANLLFTLPAESYLYEVNANNQSLYRPLLNTRVERLVLRDGIPQTGAGLTSITDQTDGNGNRFGYYQNAATGTLYTLSDANQNYSLIMTGYVQAYVYDKLEGVLPTAFILSPSLRNGYGLGLERAVLDANNIKLRVYYSQLR
jgi:hypothetical protein